MAERRKYRGENWEMDKWLETHEISLTEKFDLEHAPRRQRKHKPKNLTLREPEDILDLHGLTVEEGMRELRSFLISAKLKGYYLVKIIHGKGLHSSGAAKLSLMTEEFLNGEGRRYINSWQKAPVNQGGAGAALVFL